MINQKLDLQPITSDEKLDLQPIGSSKSVSAPEGLGERALQDILNIGGGISHGLTQGVADIGNLPRDILGVGPQFQGLQAPFVHPSDLSYQVPNALARMVPAALGIEAALPEEAASGIAGGATMGALASPGSAQSRLGGAVGGGLTAGMLRMVPGGLKSLASTISKARGNPVNILAKNFHDSISEGKDLQELNKANFGNIIKNYLAQKTNGSNLFNDFLSDAENSGYAKKVSVGTPGISFPTQSKYIVPKDGLMNTLETIEKPDVEKGILPISPDLKNSISNYRGNPSLLNAHRLQSILGKESSDFISKSDITPLDRSMSNLLKKARGTTLDSIGDTLLKNGDTDLFNKFLNARQNWAKNVIPYEGQSSIMGAVRKNRDFPSNVLNVLSKEDDDGHWDTVREHLQQNPDQTKILAAQMMHPGKGNVATVKALMNSYEKSPNVLRNLIDEQTENALNRYNTLNNLAKVGLGIGAVIGLNKGANSLEDFL